MRQSPLVALGFQSCRPRNTRSLLSSAAGRRPKSRQSNGKYASNKSRATGSLSNSSKICRRNRLPLVPGPSSQLELTWQTDTKLSLTIGLTKWCTTSHTSCLPRIFESLQNAPTRSTKLKWGWFSDKPIRVEAPLGGRSYGKVRETCPKRFLRVPSLRLASTKTCRWVS